jgi:hypothetical protein
MYLQKTDEKQDPDPLVRCMVPRIRIRTKISWIRNTGLCITTILRSYICLLVAESEDAPLLRRETSRRKAKEQSAAKREAQAELLLDGDDPTLNNPALDLEDSDVDDEWTPLKAGLEKTRLKKTSPVFFLFF